MELLIIREFKLQLSEAELRRIINAVTLLEDPPEVLDDLLRLLQTTLDES